MDIKKRIEDIIDEIIDIRRELHMYPELSQEEFETQRRIASYLDAWEIDYEFVADTGLLASIKGGGKAGIIGARADIDALPICEENNLAFKSKNPGVMHACGHDVHTAIHLAVAKIFKDLETEGLLRGGLKIFFQPAEETIGGAQRMIDQGVLENPRVDKVLALHVSEAFQVGQMQIKRGRVNAATNEFEIKVEGQAGHAAYPETGVDAIVIAANIVTALQTLVSRNTSPLNPVVLSMGKINGGTKNNVIAQEVVISGTLRTLDEETRNFAKARLEEIAQSTARVYGGRASVSFPIDGAFAPLVNDDDIVDGVLQVAKEVLGQENIYFKDRPSMGGDDFSFFTRARPGAYYFLGCGNREKGYDQPAHSPGFKIDEGCIALGIEMQVRSILKLMED